MCEEQSQQVYEMLILSNNTNLVDVISQGWIFKDNLKQLKIPMTTQGEKYITQSTVDCFSQ